MAKATCTSCGERFTFDEYDEFYEPWCGPTCAECSKAAESGEVLSLFRIGANEQALVALAEMNTAWPEPESVVQALIFEADYFARHGDLDEAALRLRCLAEPKWSREEECKQQYDAAMIETRRAREART
jgi:predicted RNA-binding Zn-ribbon protein involved in translation (DUF1610 family)